MHRKSREVLKLNTLGEILRAVCGIIRLLQSGLTMCSLLLACSGELQSLLQELHVLLLEMARQENKIRVDDNFYKMMTAIYNLLQRAYTDTIKRIQAKDCVLHLHSVNTIAQRYIIDITSSNETLRLYLQQHHITVATVNNTAPSPWSISRISVDIIQSKLWPIVLLPDRIPEFIPRKGVETLMSAVISATTKPRYIVITNNGVGSTEILIESAYLSLMKGDFALVVYIDCSCAAAVTATLLLLIDKFTSADPTTSAPMDNSLPDLAKYVLRWIYSHDIPYLVIFDHVEDMQLLLSLLPEAGAGQCVITTTPTIRDQLATHLQEDIVPVVLEHLSIDDLGSIIAPPVNGVSTLVSYFSNTIDICHALTSLYLNSSLSHFTTSAGDYISYLDKNDFPGYIATTTTTEPMMTISRRYKSFVYHLNIVFDIVNTHTPTILRLLQLLSVTSNITSNVLYDWLALIPPSVTVLKEVDGEYLLQISSLLPYPSMHSGQLNCTWLLSRKQSEVVNALKHLSSVCSPAFQQAVRNVSWSSANGVVSQLNDVLAMLSSEPAWKVAITDLAIIDFLYIDSSRVSRQDIMLFVLQPLITSNILRVMSHHNCGITVKLHKSTQQCIRLYLQQNDVTDELVTFLHTAYDAAISTSTSVMPSVTALSLLPNVLGAIQRSSSDRTLLLCELVLPQLLQLQHYRDAEMVCKRYLCMATSCHDSKWRFNLAVCSMNNKNFQQAADILCDLLSNHYDSALAGMYCEALLQLGKIDMAVSFLLSRVEKSIGNELLEVRLLLSDMYMRSEQMQKCVNLCDTVLAQSPYHFVALRRKAVCLMRLEQYDNAIVCLLLYVRYIEERFGGIIHADLPYIHVLLAQCYESKAMLNQVEMNLALAADISAKCNTSTMEHADILYQHVSALVHIGNFDTALQVSNVATSLTRTENGVLHCKLLCQQSRVLLVIGKFAEAEEIVLSAKKICDRLVKNDIIVTVLNTQSDIHKARYNITAAATCATEALEFLLHFKGATDMQKWAQYEKCGDLSAEQHRSEEAKRYYDACIVLRSQLNSADVHVAEVLEKVATLLEEKGERVLAEQYRRQADDIYAHYQSSNDVATEHNDENNYLQSQALELLVKKYGAKHPRIATALNNLCTILLARYRYSDCLPLRQKQLQILRHIHGEHHPAVATAMYNVGYIFYCLEQWDEALEYIVEALKKQQQLYSSQHELVAQSYAILGYIYFHMYQYEQSKKAWEECASIRSHIFGDAHEATVLAMNNYGIVLKKLIKYRDAELWLRKSLLIRKELFGNSGSSAVAYFSLGVLLLTVGRLVEAAEMLGHSLTIRKQINSSSADVANTMQGLAEVSIAQQRYGEAKSYLSEVVRIRTLLYGESTDIVIGSMQQLLHLLQATNSTVEASSLASRLSKYNRNVNMSNVLDVLEETTISHRIEKKVQSDRIEEDLRIDGNAGWQKRLAAILNQKVTKLSQQISEIEEQRSTTASLTSERDHKLQLLDDEVTAKESRISELEELLQEDKRYRYQLDMTRNERDALVVQKVEMIAHYDNLLKNSVNSTSSCVEVSSLRDEIALLQEEISILENVYQRENEVHQSIEEIDSSIRRLTSKIEALQFELSDGSNGDVEEQFVAILTEKRDYEVKKEVCKLQLRRVSSELDAIKVKYNVMTPTNTISIVSKPVRYVPESESESSSNESDDDAEDTGEDSTGLKKRLRKQKLLIRLLRSQISTLGVEPIEEVVSYERAESKLQAALTRLMEGDDTASDEFTKWDNFIRNHPEHKRREEERKATWERQNTALNEACLRRMRSIVPACIVSTATLSQLESQLPTAVAKRVWTKKALWLTRLSVARISKLHVADFQSKYSTQGLDEIELRAVWASLPLKFDNDERGGKANWKDGVFNGITSKAKSLPWGDLEPSSDGIEEYLKKVEIATVYRKMDWPGPFDPDEAFVEITAISEVTEVVDCPPAVSATSSIDDTMDGAAATAPIHVPKNVSSIRRRVSMFESTTQSTGGATTENSILAGIQKRKSEKAEKFPVPTPLAAGSGKMSMLEEMKAKALKRRSKES